MNSKNNCRRVVSAAIATLFLSHQTMFLSALASDITGINQSNGTFNIDPTAVITGTDMGYRKYENFTLDQGDIANLIFKYGAKDLSTFINLVDNQIVINGLVNSMRDGQFYNGKAVFVSPNGMIVGASGVLNVGSLGVYTPTKGVFDDYVKNPRADLSVLKNSNNNSSVVINGKVIATNDIDIHSGKIDVPGKMIAGTGNNIEITAQQQAENLFNSIVNTTDVHQAKELVTRNGNITLTSSVGTDISGDMRNFGQGSTNITNSGSDGIILSGNVANHYGDTNILNNAGKVEISGNLTNSNGKTTIINNGTAIDVTSSAKIKNDDELEIINNGEDGLNVDGEIIASGKSSRYINNKGAFNINEGAKVTNTTQTAYFENNGQGGMQFNGKLDNTSEVTIVNNVGALNLGGSFVNNGDIYSENRSYNTIITNNGEGGMNLTGTITNSNAKLALVNNDGELNITPDAVITNTDDTKIINTNTAGGINVDGQINNGKDLYIINNGAGGVNISGTAIADGKVVINSGNSFNTELESDKLLTTDINLTDSAVNHGEGINIASSAVITSGDTLALNSNADGGINIKGKTLSMSDTNITSNGGNVIIGDNTENNNYVASKNDINIKVKNGSVLNYAGVQPDAEILGISQAKTLLKAQGDLDIEVVDGTIGQETGGGCVGDYCTGISDAPGTRDYAKSINAQIDGTVTATTTNTDTTASRPKDLVINYAAINSDMKIDTIKADGRVILTTDYNTQDGKTRYDMINASTDAIRANVEGWGISLISSGNIGEHDNKLTFNQTKPGELSTSENKTHRDGYGMDVLANENIYIKGLDDKYTINNICSMISREGSIDAEFSGNTYIEEITAEKDIKLVTRGKSLEVNYLGTVPHTPVDYFGPRTQGQLDGGYMEPDYRDETLPNNVTLKALDINKVIRPDGEDVEGYYAYADSKVKVNNALLDNGTLDITADNIYANGVAVHFNKDGFSKEPDDSTNKVLGSSEIPTGHAVRPDDVEDINRDEHERNYYYPEGDGDGTFEGVESDVDPDDDVASDSPLEMPDEPTDPPTDEPTDPPTDEPTDPPTDEPTDPPTDEPTDPPTDEPTDPPTDEPTDPPTDEPTDPPTDEPTDPPTDEPTDPPTDEPTDPPTDEPTDPPTDEPTDPPTDEPTDPPTDEPTDPPTDEPTDPPTDEPTDPPTDLPSDEPQPVIPSGQTNNDNDQNNNGSIAYIQRKILDDSVQSIDKRQYMRYKVSENRNPVAIEQQGGVERLLDVSRGGISVVHDNELKVGDIIPVHMSYGALDIQADAQVVSATSHRAGAQFINLDSGTANQLLYLNMVLDEVNNISLK